MEFVPTAISGCLEIKPVVRKDARGRFVKTFHAELFREHGLETDFAEEYYSVSTKGVLRGLHFQLPPHDHNKIVYCVRGEVLDAVVDLRGDSPSYGQHVLLKLDDEACNMVYVPKGCAHGFYVTSDEAIMVYNVSTAYAPESDTGILWNSAGIPWPDDDPILADRDRGFKTMAKFGKVF
ncbi:MAG: dTDP-4-dehydrorhamnose 3,5-epimerase [Armatimonadetes bacterium]|nr:dTDP-4-dehydrorhamnose 3,5-epimerase [Armatimonadota bacterium]